MKNCGLRLMDDRGVEQRSINPGFVRVKVPPSKSTLTIATSCTFRRSCVALAKSKRLISCAFLITGTIRPCRWQRRCQVDRLQDHDAPILRAHSSFGSLKCFTVARAQREDKSSSPLLWRKGLSLFFSRQRTTRSYPQSPCGYVREIFTLYHPFSDQSTLVVDGKTSSLL